MNPTTSPRALARSRASVSLLLVTFASLAGAVSSGACGNDEATSPAAEGDGGGAAPGTLPGSSGGSSGGGSSSGSSSGGTSDGGAGGGAEGGAADGGARDGGPAPSEAGSQPGLVPCGAVTCPVATMACCVGFDGGGACAATADRCLGTKVACDEKADCPGTTVCCAGFQGVGSSACDDRCGVGEAQLCAGNAECGANGTCFTNRCVGGRVVRACSRLFGCSQD